MIDAIYTLLYWLPVAACLAVMMYFCRLASQRIVYLGEGDQLLLKHTTGKRVINGPAIHFPSLITTLSYKKRKGISLSTLEYVIVKDELTGETRVVAGPTVLLLAPHEIVVGGPTEAIVLNNTQCITVVNRSAGARRLVKGPTTFFPGPHDAIMARSDA